MLENSFIFLDKIGHKKEEEIWGQGILSWNDFLNAGTIKSLSASRKGHHDRKISEVKKEFAQDNSAFMSKLFPVGEHYRFYNDFKEDAVFLDIETSGYYGNITVLGMYDGKKTKTMVRGFNLDKEVFLKEISKYKIVVTFNGLSFDVPIIKRMFGSFPEIPHIDLRFVCQKIGLSGGLKSIEKQLNIKRDVSVEGLSGEDAVYLWEQYRATGDESYLIKLVKYNEEDIVNLKPLADYAISKLWKQKFKKEKN